MTRTFRKWFVSLVLTAAFVWICFRWFDKPIALWIYDIFGGRRAPTELADRILSFPRMSAIVFVVCGLAAIMGRAFSKLEAAVAMCAVSTLATIIIKDQLKFVFGRTWPDAWGPGIVSFVRDNVYGFHFFQSGTSFESFPSGHAAVAAAVLSVAWILFPNLRVHLRDGGCRRRYRPCGSQSSFSQRCRGRQFCRRFGRAIHGRCVPREPTRNAVGQDGYCSLGIVARRSRTSHARRNERLPPGGGSQSFFDAISLSIALSNNAWASSFFGLAFSSRSDSARLASDTSSPPYLGFHLLLVAHTSTVFVPAPCSPSCQSRSAVADVTHFWRRSRTSARNRPDFVHFGQ